MITQTFFILYSSALVISCTGVSHYPEIKADPVIPETINTIREIPLPQEFSHIYGNDILYSNALLDIPVRKDNTVFLFNGKKKNNQQAHYTVLDIAIGKKNLLQCADAAIKLRADFLYRQKRYKEINFISTSGDSISFADWQKGKRWKEKAGHLVAVNHISQGFQSTYQEFMEFVYSYCGTYSLSRQLQPVESIDSIQPGDIFIRGGFPGHAVTVVSVAKNKMGEKCFLLVQGFMPAQDIHLLKNPGDSVLNPWYQIEKNEVISTPEWIFQTSDLKRWK